MGNKAQAGDLSRMRTHAAQPSLCAGGDIIRLSQHGALSNKMDFKWLKKAHSLVSDGIRLQLGAK